MKYIHHIKAFFKKLSKKQIIWSAVGLLAVVWIVSSVGGSGQEAFVSVVRGSVVEEVLVTGKTKSSAVVDLGFDRSGKVASSKVSVGDKVTAWQTIAILDQSELLAELAKAKANLKSEQIKLDSIRRTSSASYENSYSEALASIKDSYTKADNAVRNNADQFFRKPSLGTFLFGPYAEDNGITYIFNFYIPYNTQLGLATKRTNLEETLTIWASSINKIKPEENLAPHFKSAEENLSKVKTFLDELSLAVNNVSSYSNPTYQTQIESYKSTASTARTNLGTAITNLLGAKEKFNTAPSAVVVGTSKQYDDVLTQEARVESLSADVSSIEANLSKTIIVSPIAGVVTKMEAKVGETVSAGVELVTIISDDKLQVEAHVSEVNIGKVKVGDKVAVTFDAFPSTIYSGSIIYIDPGETVIDGVAKYKVTVNIDEAGDNLRSGLTANLKVETSRRDEVLKIPSYALNKKEGATIVKVKVGQDIEERIVETGLRGKDGTVEVISGLKEGEQIIVSTK